MSPATGTAPHVPVLCSTVHPLEVALRCHGHRAGRRGLVRGHRGQELRVAPGWPPWHQDQRRVLPFSAEGIPPRGSATPSRGLAAPGARMLSLPEVSDLSLSRRSPRPSRQSGAQLSAPSVSGASRRCLTPACPGRAHPRMARAGGGTGKEAVGRGSHVDVPRWQMQRHSLVPGGLPAARPRSRGHPLPFSAHPWSVQCPKEAKEPRGGRDGMEEGSAGDPLSRLSSYGSKPLGGPSLPCSPPSARRCPTPALLLGGL